ncbi:MAG TPA: hypothetical protein VFU32_12970 [Ktedonobacterales bacterium]|nr:hypothetical protein [Ktedonobacterales bacterium]
MKTKVRSLSVDGASYVWRVKRLDPQHVLLRVWPAQNARQCQELHARIRFDDPWLHYGPLLTTPPERIAEVFVLDPITPARVRSLILVALQAGWQPNHADKTLAFEWLDDADLPFQT